MSYKAILFGILLLLAVPAVSSAQMLFQGSVSGTGFCNGAATKFKGTWFFAFLGLAMVVATDRQFTDVIATMLQDEIFATSQTAGAFIYTQDDTNGVGMFAATFQGSENLPTSFKGNLNEVNRTNGCFETVTIKSAKQIVP